MLLCPSLMCADFSRLGEEVDELVAAGADMFHLDVMDGHFVPVMSLGLEDVRAICKRSTIPCDVHLMTTNAVNLAPLFVEAGVSIVYVHAESEQTLNSTLLSIERLGAHPGLVINPETNFESVIYSLPVCDYVLLMTVNPGYAGQSYLEYVNPKIEQFAAHKEEFGYKIIIDGACSPERIKQAKELGADGAVLGTSALFGHNSSYAELLADLREL